ncbi:MAG: hypothetical protein M9934_05990 [Thermomicrobiales bacterium]|nr:hypothetical protein [Thermomicrobiales bacterium]MCO5227820.1 hypothetical protein [Thermomicrobiales bacterium]
MSNKGESASTLSWSNPRHLVKIAPSGRVCYVICNPDGSLIERDAYDWQSTWRGRWHYSEGCLSIRIGPYELWTNPNSVEAVEIDHRDPDRSSTPFLVLPVMTSEAWSVGGMRPAFLKLTKPGDRYEPKISELGNRGTVLDYSAVRGMEDWVWNGKWEHRLDSYTVNIEDKWIWSGSRVQGYGLLRGREKGEEGEWELNAISVLLPHCGIREPMHDRSPNEENPIENPSIMAGRKKRKGSALENWEIETLKHGVVESNWYCSSCPDLFEPDDQGLAISSFKADVLIVVATELERRYALNLLTPLPGHQQPAERAFSSHTYVFGMIGSHYVVILMVAPGTVDMRSVDLATTSAIAHWDPQAIIMVGIAAGNTWKENQHIGDVLVAHSVQSYEHKKVRDGNLEYRTYDTPPAHRALVDRFHHPTGWRFIKPDDTSSEIHYGRLLSGNTLVADAQYRDDLFKDFPGSIGIEMEGVGLARAATYSDKPWILVKGVADWADGNKGERTDLYQEIGAAAATSLIGTVLSRHSALEGLKRK